MNTVEELKQLEKDVKRNKRLASERASVLHDLIEDRLPEAYLELMPTALATFDACAAWAEANRKLLAAQAALA
jgi:hypothetical protein